MAAALALAALFLLPDYQRYQNAKKQMDAGEYLDAIENFDALGDYLSAADLSLQCKAKAINSGVVSAASTASRYATELVAGGYRSGNGVVPGSVLWYRTDDELIEAQTRQKESDVCVVSGCDKPRLFGNYACADHDCAVDGCLYPVAVGQPVCKDHLYMICKALGCHAYAENGRYCPAHTDKTNYTAPTTAKPTATNENTAPAQQESPVQQPDNSAQQDEKTPSSGQERKVRIYNSETGQWEWVSPDTASDNQQAEPPHKGQKYVRQYNPETGTWDWMWVDD